jgi:hypothetical protein
MNLFNDKYHFIQVSAETVTTGRLMPSETNSSPAGALIQ